MELAENVKQKLAEAVDLWANENLGGKPALLATCMFFSLEKEMINQAEKIKETFPD